MPEGIETTPSQDGSLDSAATALTGLLSRRSEEGTPTEKRPEQTPPAKESQQAETETEDRIESQKSDEEESSKPETEESSQPRKIKLSEDLEVTEDEIREVWSKKDSFQSDYTRKTQQLAEDRKKWEATEVAEGRQLRQQYATHLEQLKTALKALNPTEPNWEALKAQLSPEQYAERLDGWRRQQEEIQKVEKAQAEVKQREEADAQQAFQRHLRSERDALELALPELKDQAKGKKLTDDLVKFAVSRGFTEEELGQVSDHRALLLLHDAMQFQRSKEKKPEVKNKIDKVIAQSKPGAQTTPTKANQAKEARDRLRNSGRIEDGVAAIEALLNQ